jgi:hypothetical protein
MIHQSLCSCHWRGRGAGWTEQRDTLPHAMHAGRTVKDEDRARGVNCLHACVQLTHLHFSRLLCSVPPHVGKPNVIPHHHDDVWVCGPCQCQCGHCHGAHHHRCQDWSHGGVVAVHKWFRPLCPIPALCVSRPTVHDSVCWACGRVSCVQLSPAPACPRSPATMPDEPPAPREGVGSPCDMLPDEMVLKLSVLVGSAS